MVGTFADRIDSRLVIGHTYGDPWASSAAQPPKARGWEVPDGTRMASDGGRWSAGSRDGRKLFEKVYGRHDLRAAMLGPSSLTLLIIVPSPSSLVHPRLPGDGRWSDGPMILRDRPCAATVT